MRRNIRREDRPQQRRPAPPGPVPTLGELQCGTPKWVWAICNGLDESGRVARLHRAPLALAPFVIRWGAEVSSNVMRQRLRCSVCGHRGAVLKEAGVDMNTDEPLNQTMRTMNRVMDEIEGLLDTGRH